MRNRLRDARPPPSSTSAAPRPRMRPRAARCPRTSQELSEARLQLATRVVEPAHHRALRTLQDSADLLVGEALHLAEEYESPVIRVHLPKRCPHPSPDR